MGSPAGEMRRSPSSFFGDALATPGKPDHTGGVAPGPPSSAGATLDSDPPVTATSARAQATRPEIPSDLNVGATRAVLALVAMLLALEGARELGSGLTLATSGFAIYAAALLLLDMSGTRAARLPAICWADAVWCLLIFSLSGGGHGFSVLLFFPVLFAAGRGGLLPSIAIAVASAATAMVVLWAQEERTSWLHSFVVPAALLLLAPATALLTQAESRARRARMSAAQLVDALDPRRGLEGVVHKLLELTTLRFSAQDAVLALRTRDHPMRVFVYAHDRPITELPAATGALAAQLNALPRESSIALASSPVWLWGGAGCSSLNVRSGDAMRSRKAPPAFAALAASLEQDNVVLTPAGKDDGTAVWLLLGRARRAFSRGEQVAIHQMAEQAVPVLDNATLLEQLVAATAETERMRIGRDLHDSAIQPYVGLKFAIEALARRVPADSPLADDAQVLVEMVTHELHSLREIVSGLRSRRRPGEALLEHAVRRQAARFATLFGMDIEVKTYGDLRLSRRLSGELFHMVSEALSNVRRHTRARRATVTLNGGDEPILEVFNEALPGEPLPVPFEPRSLTERAADLGGSVEVRIGADGTTVRVRIPWPEEKKQ